MNNAAAISRFDLPCAMSRAISRSRSLSPSKACLEDWRAVRDRSFGKVARAACTKRSRCADSSSEAAKRAITSRAALNASRARGFCPNAA